MWQQLIVWVALQAIAYLLRPKPEVQKPPAAQQVKGPKISIGDEIPILFGTLDITEPQVVWFGDTAAKPKKVKNEGGKK